MGVTAFMLEMTSSQEGESFHNPLHDSSGNTSSSVRRDHKGLGKAR